MASPSSTFSVNKSYHSASSTENCSVWDINITLPWDNPENLVTLETERLVNMILTGVFIPVLFLVGGPLNVLNLVVFFKQGLSDRINVCLFSLALVDLIYLTLLLSVHMARVYWRLTEGHWADLRYIVNTSMIGFYGISYGPYVLSAIIAIERCVCVLFPLKARQCISTKALMTGIVTAVLVVTSLRFVVLARFKVICIYIEQTKTQVWAMSLTKFYFQNKAVIDILDRVFYGFIVVIGSSVTVLIATIVTAIKLHGIVQWRGQTSSAVSNKEIGVIRMIIYLSIEFIILSMPKVLLRLSYLFDPQLTAVGVYRNTYAVLVGFAELSSYISSVANFFVYYFSGSKFRATLHSLMLLTSSQKKT